MRKPKDSGRRLVGWVLALGLGVFQPAAAGRVILSDDFDSYEPGPVELGGSSNVNDVWSSFSGSGRNAKFERGVAIEDAIGRDGTRGLTLNAVVARSTTQYFFVGARRVFVADLSDVDVDRLRMTAEARVDIVGADSRGARVFPQDVRYAFRLESLARRGQRGVRQFDATGSGRMLPIGGSLAEAINGHTLNYRDLAFGAGEQRYQVVIVISTSVGSGFRRGEYEIRLHVDNVKLELVDPAEERPVDLAWLSLAICRPR